MIVLLPAALNLAVSPRWSVVAAVCSSSVGPGGGGFVGGEGAGGGCFSSGVGAIGLDGPAGFSGVGASGTGARSASGGV